MTKAVQYLFLASSIFTLISCNEKNAIICGLNVFHNEEFGGIDVNVHPDEMRHHGFNLGDSLDFVFSNGNELKDVPYFDGFYINKDDYVFCAYPTYKFPRLIKEYAEDLYFSLGIQEDTLLTIKLNSAGKYKIIQDTLSMKYSNNRDDFSSDEEFGNFRYIQTGNIKPNKLFRSASPVDNSSNRATYVSILVERNNIDYIFDLSNNAQKQAEYAADPSTSGIWKELYNEGRVYDVKIDANFFSDDYLSKTKIIAETIANSDGKYLIHCTEGKDRTGFFSILLEALCGSTLQEINDDYFLSYKNFYHMSEESNPDQIAILKKLRLYEMTNMLVGEVVNENATVEQLTLGARNYLIKSGVSGENIEKLIYKLTK